MWNQGGTGAELGWKGEAESQWEQTGDFAASLPNFFGKKKVHIFPDAHTHQHFPDHICASSQ